MFFFQYDFAKENGAISLAEEERLIKEQNELQEQLNNLKDEANTNNNGENEDNEDDEENEGQNVMDVNAILTPLVATANSTTTLIDDLKTTKSKPINFHEFESQNENPFELVELQTLNELDELRCVLDPTIADSKTKKKKKNVTQTNDIDDFQLDVSLTKAMHVENGKPDEKLFDIDDESDGNVYENVVFTIPTEAAQSRTNWINFDEPLRGNKPALDYFGTNSTNLISANNVYNLVDRQKSKSPLAMISGSVCDDNISMKTENESFSSTLSRTKSLPNLAESENIENGNKSELLNSHASDNYKVTQHLIESSIANTKNINFNDMQELLRQNNLQMQRDFLISQKLLEQSNLRMEENQKVINDIFANKIASRGNLQNHQLLEKQYLDNQNVLNGMFMKNVLPSVRGFSNTPPLTNHENASQLVTAHENIPPVISSHENKAHTIKTNAIFSQVASNENKNSVSPFKYTSMSEKSVSNGYANPFSAGYNPSVQNVTANETTDQFAPTDRIANIMKQYQFHRVSDSPVSQENTSKDGSAFDWYSQNSYKSNLNPFQNSQQGFNDERLSTSVFSSTTNTSTSSIAVSNKAPIHNFNSTNSGSYTFANTSQQNYRPPYPVATVNIDQSRNSIGKISQSNTTVTNLDQSPGSLVNTAQTNVPFSTQSYGISQNSFQKIPSYPSLPISSPGDVVSPGHSVSSSDNKSSTHQLPMTRGSPSNIPPTWVGYNILDQTQINLKIELTHSFPVHPFSTP